MWPRYNIFIVAIALCLLTAGLVFSRYSSNPNATQQVNQEILVSLTTPANRRIPSSPPPPPPRPRALVYEFENFTCPRPLTPTAPLKYSFSESCQKVCKFTWEDHRGPPAVAFPGHPIDDFICTVMFRDIADYVFSYPFGHFGESPEIPNWREVAPCLLPGSIIYVQTGPPLQSFCNEMFPHLQIPFILITGQSDYPQAGWCSNALLDSPLLIKWFAQNADINHPKVEIIPIGLNCWEHTEMAEFLKNFKKIDDSQRNSLTNKKECSFERGIISSLLSLDDYHHHPKHFQRNLAILQGNLSSGWAPSSELVENPESFTFSEPFSLRKLALANFGLSSWGGRQAIKDSLCSSKNQPDDDKAAWLECRTFQGLSNNIKGNPHLLELYDKNRQYLYWFSPRGNGIDTHRLWEALYLGSIPIIEHSILDPLFLDGDLPVLFVPDMKQVTRHDLLSHIERFQQISHDFPRRKLTRDYWVRHIYQTRRNFLKDPIENPEDIYELERERRRCWGRKS